MRAPAPVQHTARRGETACHHLTQISLRRADHTAVRPALNSVSAYLASPSEHRELAHRSPQPGNALRVLLMRFLHRPFHWPSCGNSSFVSTTPTPVVGTALSHAYLVFHSSPPSRDRSCPRSPIHSLSSRRSYMPPVLPCSPAHPPVRLRFRQGGRAQSPKGCSKILQVARRRRDCSSPRTQFRACAQAIYELW